MKILNMIKMFLFTLLWLFCVSLGGVIGKELGSIFLFPAILALVIYSVLFKTVSASFSTPVRFFLAVQIAQLIGVIISSRVLDVGGLIIIDVLIVASSILCLLIKKKSSPVFILLLYHIYCLINTLVLWEDYSAGGDVERAFFASLIMRVVVIISAIVCLKDMRFPFGKILPKLISIGKYLFFAGLGFVKYVKKVLDGFYAAGVRK